MPQHLSVLFEKVEWQLPESFEGQKAEGSLAPRNGGQPDLRASRLRAVALGRPQRNQSGGLRAGRGRSRVQSRGSSPERRASACGAGSSAGYTNASVLQKMSQRQVQSATSLSEHHFILLPESY